MAVNPFTGEDDGVSDTLQPIVSGARNVGQGINDALFRDPESRSALLQIGLGLMQPMAMGQTVAGHIGQGIGSGGEAVGRSEEQDVKRQKADDALTIAELRLRNARDPNVLTEYQRRALGLQEQAATRGEQSQARQDKREKRMEMKDREARILKDIQSAKETRDNIALPEGHKEQQRLLTMSDEQIEQEVRAKHAALNKSIDEQVPDDEAGTPKAAVAAPPPEKRVPGQVYPTPKGKLKWTGTGWVQP